MATDVFTTGAESCAQEVRRTSKVASIRLHDPELTARLDALFEAHFAARRRPTLRVSINHALKRGLDLSVALAGLVLFAPLMALAGLATLLETGRPILYSQIRRIRFGKRARIYKMRTMYQGADRNLDDLVNIKNNGRFLNVPKAQSSYTRVGRVLERLWIVELPQLWNILLGQMSLVGNRPIPDYVIGVLGPTREVAERFAGPQGLTGYTQIIGRENVTDEERIRLEYRYSQVFEKGDVFLEDCRIILITILTYLGLTRPRVAADFLNAGPAGAYPGDDGRSSAGRAVPDEKGCPDASPGADPQAPADDLAQLACPTCYEIAGHCSTALCRKECADACAYDAIRFERGRAVITDSCVACSACVLACPVEAIDKFPLREAGDGLHCDRCGAGYGRHEGILDLLPQRANVEPSPYFDFYESQYVADNPEVHLEDTDWKLRELRPLLRRDAHYHRMLDLGCGAGVLGRSIAADLGMPRSISADWSTQILAVARRHHPRGTYVRLDASHLPFRNRSFDLALLIDVIEHQHRPDQVLRELRRVAGHLLLRTPLEDCWYEWLRRKRKDLFRESSGHVVHYSPARIRDQLARNGWKVVKQSIRHIAWQHWRSVLAGSLPLSAKLTALGRVALRWLLPLALYRRLFVTNYNTFCEGAPRAGRPAAGPSPARTLPADRQAVPGGSPAGGNRYVVQRPETLAARESKAVR